jgi:DUF1009 family protein
MERALGLMCGSGALPARMAGEARRQGWRVIAFLFGEAPAIGAVADVTVPSRLTAIGDVLAALRQHAVSAALFCGKFSMADVLRAGEGTGDATAERMRERAGALADSRLAASAVATLDAMGIEVLDQRPFLGDWLGTGGLRPARPPTPEEWQDVGLGLRVGRRLADEGTGQTVVIKRGIVTAVEAVEGTTEAIRRGTRLAGPGAVIVKAVATVQDYRFDVPAIGPETIRTAAEGDASVVAVEAGRVLVLDREETRCLAEALGISLVSAGPGADGAGDGRA